MKSWIPVFLLLALCACSSPNETEDEALENEELERVDDMRRVEEERADSMRRALGIE